MNRPVRGGLLPRTGVKVLRQLVGLYICVQGLSAHTPGAESKLAGR
jgi:hypothetical protein